MQKFTPEAARKEIWVFPKPKKLIFVGTNQFRLSRIQQVSEFLGIQMISVSLLKDPSSPLGLHPQNVAIEKCLFAEAQLTNAGVDLASVAIIAVDALNGFVNDFGTLVYRGKPANMDEVRENIKVLNATVEKPAIVQLEVAHAIHRPDRPHESFAASTIHRGSVPLEKLQYLKSEEGWEDYQRKAQEYLGLNPLQIAGGWVWPVAFLLGVVENIDGIPNSDTANFMSAKGKLLTDAVSFNRMDVTQMLKIGSSGIIHNKMTFDAYRQSVAQRAVN